MSKKVFMVNTGDINLKGYNNLMSEKLTEYLYKSCSSTFLYTDVEVNIPFKKTNNTEKEEYIEMITGTLYCKEKDVYISEDGLVTFSNVVDYDASSFAFLCDVYSLFKMKLAMKFIYYNNQKIDKKNKAELTKEEKGNKVLKKLERKYKKKLEGRK